VAAAWSLRDSEEEGKLEEANFFVYS